MTSLEFLESIIKQYQGEVRLDMQIKMVNTANLKKQFLDNLEVLKRKLEQENKHAS